MADLSKKYERRTKQLRTIIEEITEEIEADKAAGQWANVETMASMRRDLIEAFCTAWALSGRRWKDLPNTLGGVEVEK